jgi:hypothetical protein
MADLFESCGPGRTATTAATAMGAAWWGWGWISHFLALDILRLLAATAVSSLCSTWSWVFLVLVIMAAGALLFVISAAGCVILVAIALRAVTMVILFPLSGFAILTSFPPWWLVSAASITASSPPAFVSTYDYSSLWDLKRLVLWRWHIGLMAGSSLIMMVFAMCRVVLVSR